MSGLRLNKNNDMRAKQTILLNFGLRLQTRGVETLPEMIFLSRKITTWNLVDSNLKSNLFYWICLHGLSPSPLDSQKFSFIDLRNFLVVDPGQSEGNRHIPLEQRTKNLRRKLTA